MKPAVSLALGTVAEDTEGHRWVFIGYERKTASVGLVFVRDIETTRQIEEYRAVKQYTLHKKFPDLYKHPSYQQIS